MDSPLVTGSVTPMPQDQLIADTQALSNAYNASPGDVDVALRYAASLEALGSIDASLSIYAETAARNPNNQKVLAIYSKALAAAKRGDASKKMFGVAGQQGKPGWKRLLKEGVALDQSGKRHEARILYAKAAKLAPDRAAIYNNWGLSYALDNDLASAEKLLRRALRSKSATLRVRQNLALIVGLQGRFSEAEDIARKDLEPEVAKANIGYLREMLSQPNSWKALEKIGKSGKSQS